MVSNNIRCVRFSSSEDVCNCILVAGNRRSLHAPVVGNPRLITLRCSQSDEWRVSGRDQSRVTDNGYRPASSIKDSRSKYAILESTKYLLTTYKGLQVSAWLLFKTSNSAIFQLYHGDYKLIFNEMTKPKTLYNWYMLLLR